jgi:hypothetical protein
MGPRAGRIRRVAPVESPTFSPPDDRRDWRLVRRHGVCDSRHFAGSRTIVYGVSGVGGVVKRALGR